MSSGGVSTSSLDLLRSTIASDIVVASVVVVVVVVDSVSSSEPLNGFHP